MGKAKGNQGGKKNLEENIMYQKWAVLCSKVQTINNLQYYVGRPLSDTPPPEGGDFVMKFLSRGPENMDFLPSQETRKCKREVSFS